MLSILSQAAVEVSQDPKTGIIVGATTAGMGILNINNIATIAGIIVSVVVICTQLYKAYTDRKEHLKRMKEFDK